MPTSKKKPVLLEEDVHCKLMQYKAKQKLKSAGQAISKLLETEEWIA